MSCHYFHQEETQEQLKDGFTVSYLLQYIWNNKRKTDSDKRPNQQCHLETSWRFALRCIKCYYMQNGQVHKRYIPTGSTEWNQTWVLRPHKTNWSFWLLIIRPDTALTSCLVWEAMVRLSRQSQIFKSNLNQILCGIFAFPLRSAAAFSTIETAPFNSALQIMHL